MGQHFHRFLLGDEASNVFVRSCLLKNWLAWFESLGNSQCRRMKHIELTWHILGDSLIPLAPLNLVGFYMSPTKSLTFSMGPKGCHIKILLRETLTTAWWKLDPSWCFWSVGKSLWHDIYIFSNCHKMLVAKWKFVFLGLSHVEDCSCLALDLL